MSEEKQQHEEAALAAEDLTEDLPRDLNDDSQSDEEMDGESLAEILAEDELIEDEFLASANVGQDGILSHDEMIDSPFDEEEAVPERIRIIASDESVAEVVVEATSAPASESLNGASSGVADDDEDDIRATREELKPVIESLLFVADEPLPFKQLCKVLGDVPEEDVKAALEELVADYELRGSGLEVREIAGGWRISTRPQHHEFIRKYLKSRPSARLSLPALETLAVIAYKQPITIPEILEIRGVSSSSAIKTLLEKRLIVTKGRKETVGRPMLYGTSKEFLIQFGLKDLTELPSIEDFEDFAQ
jgi:segregation and condensation protein B